uniref:EF-hand domain-containing protein n=1 Tax=Arion vulgaris TaxID=1028688 RepID=A0A0B7BT72_9EUPU
MATQNFLEKCKKFFTEANNGQPLTPGALCRAIRQAYPNFQGTDQDIARLFLEIDANEDKQVTWEEFVHAVTAKDAKEVTRVELEAQFQSLDVDKSGKLNKYEVKSLCQKLNVKVSDQQLDDLIDRADHNDDGEISYDEFLQSWFQDQ